MSFEPASASSDEYRSTEVRTETLGGGQPALGVQRQLEAGRGRVVGQVRADGQADVGADAGAQQDRGRVDGSGAQDHLTGFDLFAVGQVHPDGSGPVQGHPIDERVTAHHQVGTATCGLEVGVVRRDPLTVADRQRRPGSPRWRPARGSRRAPGSRDRRRACAHREVERAELVRWGPATAGSGRRGRGARPRRSRHRPPRPGTAAASPPTTIRGNRGRRPSGRSPPASPGWPSWRSRPTIRRPPAAGVQRRGLAGERSARSSVHSRPGTSRAPKKLARRWPAGVSALRWSGPASSSRTERSGSSRQPGGQHRAGRSRAYDETSNCARPAATCRTLTHPGDPGSTHGSTPTWDRARRSSRSWPPVISARTCSEIASVGVSQARSSESCEGRHSPSTGTT